MWTERLGRIADPTAARIGAGPARRRPDAVPVPILWLSPVRRRDRPPPAPRLPKNAVMVDVTGAAGDHWSTAGQRLWADVCLYPTWVTETERSVLTASADDADPAPVILRCCLYIDHPGPHASDGGPAPDRETTRWLRWDGRHRGVVVAPGCPAQAAHRVRGARRGRRPAGPERCRLYRDHTGPHSFVYYPDLPWPFPEEVGLPGVSARR
jgi:hypothetical protein